MRIVQVVSALALPLIGLASPVTALAAAPDGLGPWADFVVATSQGLTKAGLPVPAIRSNPTSALGVAEGDTVDGHFYSLGFGGTVTLGFLNGIAHGVFVVEATNNPYPPEKAKVEISQDGVTFFTAGIVTQDGSVSQPESVQCAHFVRLTDVSDKALFSDSTADGFDVDGVRAQGTPCAPLVGDGGGNCDSTITQTSTTNIFNAVSQKANTGKNVVFGNTGGTVQVSTGGITQGVFISNTGSSNVSTGGCCCGGTNTVSVSHNGAGSVNTVTIH